MKQVEVCILGAAGYGGGELLRLLANHPQVPRIHAVSRSHAGKPVHAAHPHLRGLMDTAFTSTADWSGMGADDIVVFAAMPALIFARRYAQLQAQWEAAGLAERVTVIDLSGDFRLADTTAFARYYGEPHPCPQALGTFVYGLSEWEPVRLRGAQRIANPGCFATAVELALLPLAGLPDLGGVFISGVTGSSGAGATPGAGTHHPGRANDFRAYKVLSHQHLGEIHNVLDAHATRAEIAFVPHSAPFVRGIFVTLQIDLDKLGMNAAAFNERYRHRYADESFVRLVEDTPRIAAVAGTNFCDIAVHAAGKNGVVLAALDNLGKGMAGQAVQNMNLRFGWRPDLALRHAAAFPA